MRLLDRYVLRSFAQPFAYCFLGIVAIWLILDMGNNLPDLIASHASWAQIFKYYRIQAPFIVVFCLPIALLLALLYSFSRLSRSNEVVSMITAGVSIPRLLLPLAGVGLAATGLMLFLTYQLAPESQTRRKALYDELTSDKPKSKDETTLLFRDRENHRTWYFERFRLDTNDARGVQVAQQNGNGDAVWKLYARSVKYQHETRMWIFSDGEIVKLRENGQILSQQSFRKYYLHHMRETPWRILSANLVAEYMGVPSLKEYLHLNSDFPATQLAEFKTQMFYRWSLPWQCMVVMLFGGPLAIVFSRRGMLGSIANALLLFFGMLFLDRLCLALGQGGRIPPEVAAWTPVAVFAVIGLRLLWNRAGGRFAFSKLGKRA
ncbi:MAG TPA: LptF/LptG family permease [Chthoniobacterales bacterium]